MAVSRKIWGRASKYQLAVVNNHAAEPPDEPKEPMAALTPSLSTQTTVSASSCKVEFRHGNMTLENPSPELLTVLIRELTGRGR